MAGSRGFASEAGDLGAGLDVVQPLVVPDHRVEHDEQEPTKGASLLLVLSNVHYTTTHAICSSFYTPVVLTQICHAYQPCFVVFVLILSHRIFDIHVL